MTKPISEKGKYTINYIKGVAPALAKKVCMYVFADNFLKMEVGEYGKEHYFDVYLRDLSKENYEDLKYFLDFWKAFKIIGFKQ